MAGKAVGRQPEADRELARALLTATGDALDYAYLARQHDSGTVHATKSELERSRTPLAQMEPKLDGSLSRTLRDCLCTIGAKIRPDLSADQANQWVGALLVALSDLPHHVAAKAAQRALHVPFQFPSEVEAKVRDLAQEHLDRIEAAIRRCDAVTAAIHEALHPKHKALPEPPPPPGERTISDELVHSLQSHAMGREVVRMGLAKGYVLPEQLTHTNDMED
jgi:hypothetical protein